MRVLICGGAGYIGSHVAKDLRESGYEPVVFDNFSKGHRWAVQFGELFEGNLLDRAAIVAALKKHSIESVVQLAGSINVGESMREPGKYFENNFVISLNLLEAMRKVGVGKIVFSSTAAVYGDPESIPIGEESRKVPVNPYGEAKWFTERLLRWYDEVHGIRSMALRYFNAAGADRGSEIGELHDPETHLIPLVLLAAMGLRPPLQVFGFDYPTPDGTAIRDYVHVTDLAKAHRMSLEYLGKGGTSNAVNLGAGKGYSVNEVIRAAELVLGRPVPHQLVARRAGDPPQLVASASKAFELLGWKTEYSELPTLVGTAAAWLQSAQKKGFLANP